MSDHNETILIIDFGSQFSQLIARRVREAGVYCEIIPHQMAEAGFFRLRPRAVILSGGPESAFGVNAPRAPQAIFDANVPILGICYGQMALCMQMGGKSQESDHREFGAAKISIKKNCKLFDGVWKMSEDYPVWMSHGDRVIELPDGFEVFAQSPGAPFAVFGNDEKKMYGVMFHPEVAHTPDGERLLANFVHKISGLKGGWTMSAYKDRAIDSIRRQVGDKRVICGLSGGVDSSVAALLVHEAVGDQLTCILVDHGLMRENEATEVVAMYREHYDIPLILVDAADTFINALEGKSDPETKRRIIGRLFIKVFEEQAKKLGGADFLVQGTLYPDVIESVSVAGGSSVTIKSHHNVGGLPETMNMRLIEPLRELFKDEVRKLGSELGLPEHFIGRHPFPGPGLAIRCIGKISREKLEILRKADGIYLDEIRKAGLYDKIWQAFATLLPVQTVGVMGDSRTYEFVCALRAVTAVDGMTADFYHHDMEFLGKTATRIINETRGINRVVYDITSKPPGTIEWE